MSSEQRKGLRELSEWVASIRSTSRSDLSDLDRVIAGTGTEPAGTASARTTGELTVDEASDDAVSTEGAAAGDDIAGNGGEPAKDAAPGDGTAAEDGAAADVVATDPDAAGEGGDAEVAGGGSEDDDEGDRKKRSPGRVLFDWVVVIGIALLVAIVIRTFVLAHFVVDGTSMASTLHSGDRVFVNKLSYRLHEPNRGDVVVLHELDGTEQRDLIKRVIALEGETIEMRDCEVYIDGRLLEEPYLDPELVQPGRCGAAIPSTEVPDDHVFVMGDNRNGSQDSRRLGPIDEDEIVGRAFVVFWPSDHLRWL